MVAWGALGKQNRRVRSNDTDILMRLAAFERVRLLSKMHDHLTQKELRSGFEFNYQRVPLVNPQRGIFKPRSMRYLLSIRTVFPRPGGRVWYDDQREVHARSSKATTRSTMPLWGMTRTPPTTNGFERHTKTGSR